MSLSIATDFHSAGGRGEGGEGVCADAKDMVFKSSLVG